MGDKAEQGRDDDLGPGWVSCPDLAKRNFLTSEPDKLHDVDFAYVPIASGFGYTAFVIDAVAGLIVA